MRCPRCQQENPAGVKFCGECGTKLEARCSQCGAGNPPTNKFCHECGTALSAQESTPPSPAAYTPKHLAERILTSKAALEGERKHVTVLFADLKGSMELLADRDPEEARKLLDPVLERMMEAVHHYEGTVNQVMGDGIMALFGAPIAHEDHAVRACYAALRMQEQVKRYAEVARRTAGVPVHIRVGMNSGEVVVRSIGSDLHMDYTAVGQTTHLAARMEQLARQDAVLITADTARFAEGYVEVEPLGAVPVKGVAAPVEVYEVKGAGPVRTRLQASATRGLTRFVGRHAELEQLRAALDQAGRGSGQVVAVVGEPGVGKSRLFHEFIASHRTRGWLTLASAAVSYGKATAYLPVLDLLRGYFRIEGRDDTRAIREKVAGKMLMLDRGLEDAISAVLALLDALPDDSPFGALDPPRRRQLTLAGIKRLLLCESRVQPLLLVFEDLHWIDSETQAFLDGLVESLPGAPVLLLVNYRPEYRHAWGGRTYYRQLRIDPLAAESAEELLSALLGDDHGLVALKRLLIERTEGNPLFVEECVRTLVETAALSGARGAYRAATPLQRIQVPASVQAILAARIDRLAPRDKELLQTAAVIGKDVPFALLARLAELEDETLRRGLVHLQAAEFLYETNLFPELEYTFKHALTHEVAYGGLLQERRRAVHARVVEGIERLYADRLGDHLELLAHHALRAELWDKAVMHLREAGRRAVQRSAHRMAATCFEDALSALRQLPETRATAELGIDLSLELRVPLSPLGSPRRRLEVMREANRSAAGLGDQRRLALTVCHMIEPLVETGQLREAIEAGERALDLAEILDDVGIRVLALRYMARAYESLGDYARAIQSLRRSLKLLGSLEREHFGAPLPSGVAARTWLAWCLAELGEFAEAAALGREALRVAELVDQPLSRVHAQYSLGTVHFIRGELDEAIAALEHALAQVRTWDIAGLFHRVGSSLGIAYATAARLAEALPLLESAVEHDWRGSRARSLAHLAQGYLLGDRTDDASSAAARALELAREHGERANEALTLCVLGDIATHSDPFDVTKAEAHYRNARVLADELGMRPLVAHCHLGLGKLYRRTGNREQAQEHLTTATAMYREMDMRFWREQADADLAELR